MTDRRSYKMQGVAELKASLNELGTQVSTKVGVTANRKAAIVGRDALIEAAPHSDRQSPGSKEFGHLRENIRVRKVKSNKATKIRHIISSGKAYWARFVELGTAKMSAMPFWRPTIERLHEGLFKAQTDELRTGIDRAARRAARLAKRKG